jgi:tetratricopeptide (TPR) repeat protein
MEKIRCFGPSESTELDVLSKTLTESECKEDPETLLLLAILQSKYAPNALLTTLSRSPQTVIDLGKLILADLSSGGDFNSLNPVIADLAAYSAWKTDPVLYKEPLLDLAEMDKFKTPIVLYATGEAIADSEPNKAITLLIDAGMMQQKQKSMLLDVEPFRIAEQVIGLVYNSFAEKEVDCRFAIDAFDFFASVASDKMTEEKRYLYGWLLLECGKTQEAAQTFARLANTNDTVWRDKANLEILKIKINAGIDEQTLPQLRDFIINCTGQDEQKRLLRLEAMDIYCRTMLSSSITDSPAKVLDLLDAAERTPGLRYDLFRAQALYQSGRLEESARYMSKAIMEDGKSSAVLAAKIASDIVDEIELWQKDANDFNELLRNCAALADFAHKSTNTPQTNLLFAETSILQGKIFLTPFSPDENDVTWLRVQARLLMTQGKFDQSAKIWARIADLRRNEPGRVNQKSYGWWQAKFYELDCLAKSPSADRQNIAHAIDVLISSNPEIPAPWAEKLDILKQHCAAN